MSFPSVPSILCKTLPKILLLSLGAMAPAQSKPTPSDASWAKVYATSCGNPKHACPPSSEGYENAFNGDARLYPMLKASLPQHESWWVNGKAGSTPVSSIVQEFIGVPRELLVDSDRFVTATGCVPHDCTTNGMLWIDTGAHPATVIFAAEVMITSVKGGDQNHLWLCTRSLQNFEALPPGFLASLQRWHKAISTSSDPQTVTVATLVQPNGRMEDMTWDTLFYKQNAPGSRPATK